jgi:hypothetical protein
MRSRGRSRLLPLAASGLALAGLVAIVVLTGRFDALSALPAVIGFAVMACGRYPGEDAITRLRTRRDRPRRRGAPASLPPRPPIVARCIGGALRRGFARRGPPPLPA